MYAKSSCRSFPQTLGREHFNFPEWEVHPTLPEHEGECEEHQHGAYVIREVLEACEMPPAPYLLLHPEARLSEAERQILIQGLPEPSHE